MATTTTTTTTTMGTTRVVRSGDADVVMGDSGRAKKKARRRAKKKASCGPLPTPPPGFVGSATTRAVGSGRRVQEGLFVEAIGDAQVGDWQVRRGHDVKGTGAATDTLGQEMCFYVRALPDRCKVSVVNKTTGETHVAITAEGARTLARMVGTQEAFDWLAALEEKEALRAERAVLTREIEANAQRLVERQKMPAAAFGAIAKDCRRALDAKRRRDNAKCGRI